MASLGGSARSAAHRFHQRLCGPSQTRDLETLPGGHGRHRGAPWRTCGAARRAHAKSGGVRPGGGQGSPAKTTRECTPRVLVLVEHPLALRLLLCAHPAQRLGNVFGVNCSKHTERVGGSLGTAKSLKRWSTQISPREAYAGMMLSWTSVLLIGCEDPGCGPRVLATQQARNTSCSLASESVGVSLQEAARDWLSEADVHLCRVANEADSAAVPSPAAWLSGPVASSTHGSCCQGDHPRMSLPSDSNFVCFSAQQELRRP